jgi:CheY-like chemotaxis protein
VTHKLLLADDSITIQKVIELILAEEEFEIKSANNGEEALALIPSYRPDIILADIEMPKMNGYQLCDKIKQDPSTSNIPVILLTGAFEPLDEELAKHVKADDFIIKPFESQDLISKINAALTISAVDETEPVEGIMEAEAIGIEELPAEEDLWAMEEITESKEISGLPAEEEIAAGTEEFIEISEEAEVEAEAEAEAAIFEEPAPSFAEKAKVADIRPPMPETELPSKNEIKAIFEKTVQEKMSSLVSSLDIKEAVLTALTPSIKDSVEKILWEVTPDLVERMLKEMLKGSLESLTKEVEKVIWETVPDLAETMISKEIERIRSEF